MAGLVPAIFARTAEARMAAPHAAMTGESKPFFQLVTKFLDGHSPLIVRPSKRLIPAAQRLSRQRGSLMPVRVVYRRTPPATAGCRDTPSDPASDRLHPRQQGIL